MSGTVSYLAGSCAEEIVARQYSDRGFELRETRWRGAAGEIDLIFEDGETLVFVEVKKSRNFATAAARVSQRQMRRIYASADHYLGGLNRGSDSNARFDVALVDQHGVVEILENAFGQ